MLIVIFFRFGRHSYQEATKINCRTDLSQVNWDKFQYMVFDIPTLRGSYKVRYDELGMFLLVVLCCVVLCCAV